MKLSVAALRRADAFASPSVPMGLEPLSPRR